MKRLQQDFKSEIDECGYYAVEPNLVIVEEANKETIIDTINKLYKLNYFSEIKSIGNMGLSQLILVN